MILAEALIVVMLIGLLAFVLYPVFRGREDGLLAIDRREPSPLRAVYGQIYELDFDYQMGKLTEEDYRNLRHQLVVEAARRRREERQREEEMERLLEDELARRSRTAKLCPACETEVLIGARFCHVCGFKL